MSKGFVYILECADGSYYTGSTKDLKLRLEQHKSGNGSNHTKKRLPLELVYYQEFDTIDEAFSREKQIQGWNRLKKEALIKKNFDKLPELSQAFRDIVSSRTSDTQISDSKTFYSPGKLLLTAEYVVLDGALALALPTKFGQSLTVESIEDSKIIWESIDNKGSIWFEDVFSFNEISSGLTNSRNAVSIRLLEILNAAKKLNPKFLNSDKGFKVTSKLEFPQNWGLGSSSTLINNIADWASIDAYELLKLTFGGSGYDIACAQNDKAITYKLNNHKPEVNTLTFNPSFKEHLYFIFLNKKQNSRDGIAQYKLNTSDLSNEINQINTITEAIINCESLMGFEKLINEHEIIIASIIKQDTVKTKLFNDFGGSIKSLGAWGGDFILAASKTNPTDYFKSKGYDTILTYNDMILN